MRKIVATAILCCLLIPGLLAAAPNRSYLEVHGFGLDRYIAEPLVIRDGNAIAPERAGHGVSFDWNALAKLSS